MLKTLGAQIKEFKKDSFLTPVFMILEVLMETIIPLMMASIIDNGVEPGYPPYLRHGGCMVIVRMHFPVCRNDGWKIRCPRFRRICAQLTKSNV